MKFNNVKNTIFNNRLIVFIVFSISIVTLSLIGITRQKTKMNSKEIKSAEADSNGIIYALLSVICAVLAAVLSRIVLIRSGISPFHTTELRLISALIVLLPIVKVNYKYLLTKASSKTQIKLLISTLFGTNIGILLQQIVFKLLPIGLGWTLLSTSPVISLLFARAEGDEITWQTLGLTLTTILGIGIVFI